MMARSHSASGWCAGLAVAPALGLDTVPTLVFAVVVAGFSLLPDLDCENATASRALGYVTEGLSWLLRKASRGLYAVTRTARDDNCSGEHRHASHTIVFALLLGFATWLGTGTSAGRWVTLGVLAFGVLLAQAALGDWIAIVGAVGALGLATHGLPEALDGARPWLWIAVTLGCVVHILGDSATLAGCPILAPIPIRGQVWLDLGTPRFMRFRTGGKAETRYVFPAFAVLGVLLVPGAWSTMLAVLHA